MSLPSPSFRPRGARVTTAIGAVLAVLAWPTLVEAQATQPPPVASGAAGPSAPVQPLPSAAPLPPTLPPPAPAPAAAPVPYAPPPNYPVAESQGGPTPGEPLYEKWWFWTAIGAFAVTTVVIIAASSSSGPPKTELGNMAAY